MNKEINIITQGFSTFLGIFPLNLSYNLMMSPPLYRHYKIVYIW